MSSVAWVSSLRIVGAESTGSPVKNLYLRKNHKRRKLLAEGGEVPHLRGLIECSVLILIEIGLVFSVGSLLYQNSKRKRRTYLRSLPFTFFFLLI